MDYKEKVIALLSNQELSKEQKEKLENIFPELKESEDESMRKALYADIRTYIPNERGDKYIAWLEKQCQVKESHISQHESKTCEENNEFLTNEDERNLAWSEEDEQMVLTIEQVMNCAVLLNIIPEKIDNIRSWLKSLRPQKKQRNSTEKQGQKLDATEVIEWINNQACCGYIEDIEVEKFVEQFKKDFKL